MDTEQRPNLKDLKERAGLIFQKDVFSKDKNSDDASNALTSKYKICRIYSELLEQELIKSENLLINTESKYSELYNLSPAGFMTLNEEGIVKEINFAMADLLKTNRRDLLLENICNFIRSEKHNDFCEFLHRSLLSDNISLTETDLIDNNGEIIHCRIKAKKSIRQNNTVIMAVHDITDHVSNEKRLEKLLKEISSANETINRKQYELQEMNYKLEKIKNELDVSIKYKDNFLNTVYSDLTLVFTRFLILSEEIFILPDSVKNERITQISQDLYDSVKATLKMIDKYYKL